MKTLLSLIATLLLFAPGIYGQVIERNETDEFTGTRIITTHFGQNKSFKSSDKIATEHIVYAKAGYFGAKESEMYLIYLFLLTTVDFGCLSEYSGQLMLLFEDGSTITLKQFTSTDCGESPVAGYILVSEEESKLPNWQEVQKENVQKIIDNPIKKIRIFGSEGYYDYELIADKKTIFSKHLVAINAQK